MEQFKFKFKRGIHDLKSLYAFHATTQGDEYATNSIQEYESSKGWLAYTFSVPMTDEAIQAEVEARRLFNESYIQQLHSEGRFGEEYEVAITATPNPIFDTPKATPDYPLSSYRLIFFDTSINP
jgi:hypothetical protein